jgi:hypothetical protein
MKNTQCELTEEETNHFLETGLISSTTFNRVFGSEHVRYELEVDLKKIGQRLGPLTPQVIKAIKQGNWSVKVPCVE